MKHQSHLGCLSHQCCIKTTTDDYNGICYVITTKAKNPTCICESEVAWAFSTKRSAVVIFHHKEERHKNIGLSCVILKLPIRRRGVRKSQGRLVRFSRPSHPPLLVVSLSPGWWWTWSMIIDHESSLNRWISMSLFFVPKIRCRDICIQIAALMIKSEALQIAYRLECIEASLHWEIDWNQELSIRQGPHLTWKRGLGNYSPWVGSMEN